MSEALLLYAQFLKEFATQPMEENSSIKWVIGGEGELLMILRFPEFVTSSSMSSSAIYQRTIEWFGNKLSLVPPAYPTTGADFIVEGGAWWDFCIVNQETSLTEEHYVYV